MAKTTHLLTFGFGLACGVAVTIYFGDEGSLKLRKLSPPETVVGQKPKRQNQALSRQQNDQQTGLSSNKAVAMLEEKLRAASSAKDIKKLESLIEQAAAFDPGRALENALNLDHPEVRRDALLRLIHHWIFKDQTAALEAIDSIDNLMLRRQLHREAAATLANRFPVRAVALLEDAPWSGDNSGRDAWGDAFANWAKQDLDGATEKLLSLNLGSAQGKAALASIASHLAKADAESALAWGETLPGTFRSTALIEVLLTTAKTSPMVAARNIEKADLEIVRSDIASIAAEAWARTDVAASLEWANELSGDPRNRAINAIAQEVFNTDPGEALEIVQSIPTAQGRSSLIERFARLQIVAEPEEGVKWIESLLPEDQTYAWGSASRMWAQADPATAASFASDAVDPAVQKQMVEAVSSYWGKASPSEAAAWAAESLSGGLQRTAMSRVLDSWAREDGESAAAFAVGVDSSEKNDLTRQVVNRWAHQDPADAAAWTTAHLESGEVKTSLTNDIVSHWLRRDSVAASQWISGLPESEVRDSAVTRLVRTIESDDPEAAAEWAETIADPKLRESTQKRILRSLESNP